MPAPGTAARHRHRAARPAPPTPSRLQRGLSTRPNARVSCPLKTDIILAQPPPQSVWQPGIKDRQRDVEGKSEELSVDPGSGRIMNKKKLTTTKITTTRTNTFKNKNF